MGRPIRRRLVAPVVFLAAVLGGVLPVGADVAPPHRVVSNYETATGLQLHRDAGVSVPLPPMPGQPAGENRSLWIFGDTFQSDANGNPVPPALPFWPGTWGAIGPYTPGQVPTSLSHFPTPTASPGTTPVIPNNNGPSPLVSYPSGLKLPNGQPCSDPDPNAPNDPEGLYQAPWTLGATRGPAGPLTLNNGGATVSVPDGSQLVFMAVWDTCVYRSAGLSPCADSEAWAAWAPVRWTFQALRLVAYRPADNSIVASSTPFQTGGGSCLPWQQTLTQPIFAGGFLYMYGSNCEAWASGFSACVEGRVTAARVPVGQLHLAASYQWATSSGGWSSNYQDAATVLPSTPGHLGPFNIDVHDFSSVGEGFLLLEQSSMGGHYNIYEASTPAGPWALRQSSAVNGCLSGPGEGCYAIYGHPELSTPGHLMFSYVNVTEAFVVVTDIGAIP